MSKNDDDFSFLVAFQDDVGDIEESAFEDNLPEGLTLDTFEAVDQYRDGFAAHVVDQMADHGMEYFKENPDAVLSVSDYSLGGYTSMEASLSPDGTAVVAITANGNSALDDILKKTAEMFADDQ